MPELPEVETVKRGLEQALAGRRLIHVDLRRRDLRFPLPEGFDTAMRGARIEALERRAKYILVHCSNGKSLIWHLGMTGRFSIVKPDGTALHPGTFYHEAGGGSDDSPHDHVIYHLDNGVRVIYNDARRFGFMDWAETLRREEHKLLRGLGPEPLGDDFHADYLAARLAGMTAPIKTALLDQRVVAGLGNIYVAEALYRARISPRLRAGRLVKRTSTDPRLAQLVRHVQDILNEAIALGGSTLQDFRGTSGATGTFQQHFQVYGREGEPCLSGCGHVIKRILQSGRSTFFCPSCQK